ncbi:NAD-dependent epimerase/dehydratase family protein [Ornithinimicrobium cavernae]|uniref:NAD-dependent epimerase/dehydratase family protein n=1 Tax=Ornithinimicrobium cavernae TaxID=2666047 RepID=UPI000D6965FD|nr:NAD-dependent epimerase/dehydratase family protein [Ornithinimicrobium cavernae]
MNAESPTDDRALEDLLSRPRDRVGASLAELDGPLVVLGAGGKMGPTLALMARRALVEAGSRSEVIAVSRFSDAAVRKALESQGVCTVAADLTDPGHVADLPDAGGVVFMLGMKFGSTGQEPETWWSNAAVPAFVASRYRGVPTVVYSTGNVYPMVPLHRGGSREGDRLAPVGEYAQSCLARERLFMRAAQDWETPTVIFRLNYACELRYGILVDLALQISRGEPVDITMPAVNLVWQRDAVAWSLAAFDMADVPARVLNATGPEQVPVSRLATWLGEDLNLDIKTTGTPAADGLLSDASLCVERYGYPSVPPRQLARWVAEWVRSGGSQLDKPTKFQQREGRF